MVTGDIIILRKPITMSKSIDDGNTLQQIADGTIFDDIATSTITSHIHVHRTTKEGVSICTQITAGVDT